MRSNEGMSTPPFEQLEARVAFLERELRRTVVIIDNIEMRTDTRLKAVSDHLDKQDIDMQKLSASVDQRFEHVYGELADIKSNTTEIRNILATLVERLNKPS